MMSIRKKFAFTIIEVLVVVAIISTLIAIGLNEYSSSLNTTRTVTFRENVSAIEDCLNVYFSVNHRYPDTLEEIRGCLNKTPINPFTNEDMLTDGSITYTPLDDNLEYRICITQRDVDDVNNNGVVEEVLPLSTKTACIGNTQTSVGVTFARNSVAYTSNGAQVAANQPRFEQGQFGQAVLVEERTTNLISSNCFRTIYSTGRGITLSYIGEENGYSKYAVGGTWTGGTYPYMFYIQRVSFIGGVTYSAQARIKFSSSIIQKLTVFGGINYVNQPMNKAGTTYNVSIGDYEKIFYNVGFEYTSSTSQPGYLVFRPLSDGTTFNAQTDFIWVKYIQVEQKPYATSFIDGTRSPETLTIPTAGVLNPQEGTIEFMVNLNTLSPSTYNAFFTSGDFAPLPRILIMREFVGGDVNKIRVWDGDGSSEAILTSVTTLQAGIWYYVAFTWSPSGRKLYVNGVLEASNTRSNNLGFATLAKIGSWGNESYLNGLIDDLRISNRARTDEEIAAAYQSGQPMPIDEYTTYLLRFSGALNFGRGGYYISPQYDLSTVGSYVKHRVYWQEDADQGECLVYAKLDNQSDWTQLNNGGSLPIVVGQDLTGRNIQFKAKLLDLV